MGTNILVTGATGNVGRELVRLLWELDYYWVGYQFRSITSGRLRQRYIEDYRECWL